MIDSLIFNHLHLGIFFTNSHNCLFNGTEIASFVMIFVGTKLTKPLRNRLVS